MNHNHEHCQHTNLKYCSKCDVVYCSCGREWGNYNCGLSWTYTNPWWNTNAQDTNIRSGISCSNTLHNHLESKVENSQIE